MISRKQNTNKMAFTVVELLIVIVIIGILAAISFVSYSGISLKVVTASLQSDLSSDAKLLKMYYVEYGYYPDSIDANNCPNTPTVDIRYCLKASSGNTLAYAGSDQSFTLTATNSNGTSYYINENGQIAQVGEQGGSGGYAYVWDSGEYERANDIAQTSDGGYVVVGESYGFYGDYSGEAFISKYAASGTLLWTKTWGGASDDMAYGVTQTSDGGYAITGHTDSYGNDENDAFIAKYTADGDLLWSKTLGSTDPDWGHSIIQTTDGGFAITGTIYDEAFIAKYTADGDLLWGKTLGGININKAFQPGDSIIQTTDGGYVISGKTSAYGDAFIAKYTADGTLSWNRTWGGALYDIASGGVIQTSDGGYVMAGNTNSFGAGDTDCFLAGYASDGTLLWSKTWGGTGKDEVYGIIKNSDDDNFFIAGITQQGYGVDNYGSVFLASYTSGGNLSWSKTFGGAEYDGAEGGVVRMPDGDFVIAGESDDYDFVGYGDVLTVRFKPDGTIDGCSAPKCQSITATTSSISPSTSSPTTTVTSLAATVTSPTVTSIDQTPTITKIAP